MNAGREVVGGSCSSDATTRLGIAAVAHAPAAGTRRRGPGCSAPSCRRLSTQPSRSRSATAEAPTMPKGESESPRTRAARPDRAAPHRLARAPVRSGHGGELSVPELRRAGLCGHRAGGGRDSADQLSALRGSADPRGYRGALGLVDRQEPRLTPLPADTSCSRVRQSSLMLCSSSPSPANGLKSLGAPSGPRSIILAATTYSTAASLTASRVSAPTKDRTARPTCVLPEPLSRHARDLAPAPDALTNRLPAQNPEAGERYSSCRCQRHTSDCG
jgi:hypothetical protein